MTNDQNKIQSLLWWITSIAVSVLCCSVLFVLFASYLVDTKDGIRDNATRINMLEDRQNRLQMEVEFMRHPPPAAAAAAPAAAPAADTGIPVGTAAPIAVPSLSAPAETAPTK